MLNDRLSLKSTTDNMQVFTGKSGKFDITVQFPFNDDTQVKVFVDDSYVGSFCVYDVTEDEDISTVTETFLWNTNALHDC